MKLSWKMNASALVLAALVAPHCALAEAAPGDSASTAPTSSEMGPIVVTARKRSENVQRVPIAITVQSGEQLEQKHVQSFADLGRFVPSLSAHIDQFSATSMTFAIRGQSAGDILLANDQAVGLYEDAVNIPHPVGTALAFVDIASIEVLKGPQGTLYGRNTTGGAVNVNTRGADYDGYHGFLSGEVGNYEDGKVTAAINIPIIDKTLAIRLVGQYYNRQGYGETVNGQHPGGDHKDALVRLSVKYDPTSNLSSTTKIEYVHASQVGPLQTVRAIGSPNSGGGFVFFAEAGLELGCAPATPISGNVACGYAAALKEVNNDYFHSFSKPGLGLHLDGLHVVEDIKWAITPDLLLRSITGLHYVNYFQHEDYDGTSFQLVASDSGIDGGIEPRGAVHPWPYKELPDQQTQSWTQEFDLSGHALGHLDWLVGIFGSNDHGNAAQPNVSVPLLATAFGGNAVTGTIVPELFQSSWGIYTQEDVHLSDKATLTLGIRYSEERQRMLAYGVFFNTASGQFTCGFLPGTPVIPSYTGCPFPSKTASNGISYLASFQYQLSPDNLLYIKTSRGFRGGAVQQGAIIAPPVKPEFATDYEIGLKNEFLDHHLRLNVDGYYTNYTNKQVQQSQTIAGDLLTYLANAATARIYGFEAEATYFPASGLSFHATGSYENSKYVKFLNAPSPSNGNVDASGQPFSDPDWQLSVGGRYEHSFGADRVGLQLDWAWHSHFNNNYVTADPLVPTDVAKSFYQAVGLVNGRLDYTIPDKGLTIALFATNLLNKHYQTLDLNLMAGLGYVSGQTEEPRMWGLQIKKTFGAER